MQDADSQNERLRDLAPDGNTGDWCDGACVAAGDEHEQLIFEHFLEVNIMPHEQLLLSLVPSILLMSRTGGMRVVEGTCLDGKASLLE